MQMRKMGADDGGSGLPENHNRRDHEYSNTEVVEADKKMFSGPLNISGPLNKNGGRKVNRFNIKEVGSSNESVKYNDIGVEEPELILMAKGVEKRTRSMSIRHVSEELKRLTSFPKRQKVGPSEMKKKSTLTYDLNGLKFIGKSCHGVSWEVMKQRFHDFSDGHGLLQRSHFGECIGLIRTKEVSIDFGHGKEEIVNESRYFSERLFDSLCRQRNIRSESINIVQFREFWDQITNQSPNSRLQIFFDMVDKDGDGRITKDEVMEIIILSALDNKLPNIKKKVDEYATLIMEELDKDNLGYIMIKNLETLMFQESTHDARGESQNFIQILTQDFETDYHESNPKRTWYEDLNYFLHNNWKRCWVLVLWIAMMIGLFTWKYIEYKHRAVYDVLGSCVCIAKGAAETLKLNMAIMLLPVCRNTITWLRNKTKLGVVVPFDDNINFHQVIAVAITIGVGLHAISHLACDFPRLIHATEEEYKPLQQFFGDQPENYWHFLKEVEGYTGIIMVVLMTIAFTLATPRLRRSELRVPSLLKKLTGFNAFKNSKPYGAFVTKLTAFIRLLNKLTGFNAFWYSHHLFVIVYAMLIVHGIKLYLTKEWYKKTTWMYLVVPILLYACERLLRTFRSRLVDQAPLRKVAVYPGNVLTLHMSKPKGFKYASGQYMFVKYADVSSFEWHPFSITSAPGDDYLSVHIQARGDWTKDIKETFEKKYSLKNEPERNSVDFEGGDENIPKVLIDGPYGAPSLDYKEYDVVLLVGLGIGATPMISIVKDILNNMKAEKDIENGGIRQNDKPNAYNFRTKRAYFYWSTGEQATFDWFKGVMNDVAELDKNGVIEMHCHCTSVYEKGDARSAFISMLQKIGYARKGVDVVSNTRVMSHFGRPVWRNVYKQIAENHKGSRIGVFFCGRASATQELKHLALDTSDSSTKFEFHKENF